MALVLSLSRVQLAPVIVDAVVGYTLMLSELLGLAVSRVLVGFLKQRLFRHAEFGELVVDYLMVYERFIAIIITFSDLGDGL